MLAPFVVLAFLLVSACVASQTPLDAKVPGSRALTGDEVTQRYAGNSIKFGRSFNGPIDSELFFARDGSLQVVDLDREMIQQGTWTVSRTDYTVLRIATSGFENGKVFRTDPEPVTMFVNLLPDGRASVFTRSAEGAAVVTQPKPTPGFKARARYEALQRKIAAAIGT